MDFKDFLHATPFMAEIPGSEYWLDLHPIETGDSSDLKYKIKDQQGRRFLLRLADCTRYDQKKQEQLRLQHLYDLGLPVPKPILFGFCDQGRLIYLMTEWYSGKAGPQRLLEHRGDMQYTLGCETAVCLKSIHNVTRTAAGRSWSNRIDQQIATLQQQCPRQITRMACVQHMLRFLTEQAFRVEDRPITWLHGDLHADNLVLSYEDSVYLIDFEKSCLGDPVSDLCPLLVDLSPHSVPFVSALLDCYFCNRVDIRLLTLVAFYSALDVLSRLVRDVSADAPAQQESLARAARLTRDYAGFKSMVPVWFKPLPALPGKYME